MRLLVLTLLAVAHFIAINTAYAAPFTGSATFLDPTNQSIGTIAITGNLDTANSSMTVDPFIFLGNQWLTQSVELLGTGTFTRPDGFGGTISTTVNPGQLGAYMDFHWAVNVMPNFMIWDVNSSANGSTYTTVDSDGDGIPGHAFVAGPFIGFSVLFNFNVGDPPPDIEISIGVTGGTVQECTETGGSKISLNAAINLSGGADLGSIEWFVDGQAAGSGDTLTPFLTLGTHTIDAHASTTTGESDSDSLTLTVVDTTPPILDVGFVSQGGQPITVTSGASLVKTSILANDICDPTPITEGTAVPVFAVNDGDVVKIRSRKLHTVKLPTTAIELSATATDASGNSSNGMAVLIITE